MKNYQSLIVLILASTLWIGFVSSISFMEARLKFSAPGVSLAIGVGIGRVVFHALNSVEWFLAISILASILLASKPRLSFLLFILPFGVLLVQTYWLLPELDLRAEQLLRMQDLAPSSLHLYYIGLELIKVFSLACTTLYLFKPLRDEFRKRDSTICVEP
ncbi:MAG: hypothetical protein EP332_12875 [Bacteroidetes bacterium]|nr:MAG: hypothetical protein EP332_12875 [Bacteroidota bacterium]